MIDASPWHIGHETLEQIRKYVAKMPVSVSGQGGHLAAWKVACVLMKGFALSIEHGFQIMSEWNEACHPPWTDSELIHKLEDASTSTGPVGYLRESKPERLDAAKIRTHNPSAKNAKARQIQQEKTVHETLEKVVSAIAWKLAKDGLIDRRRKQDFGWIYYHEDGTEAGAVFRWNKPDKTKTFGQATKVANGWVSGGMPSPRPFYRLPQIKDATEVVVVESEKVAKRLHSQTGLQTVSPSQGAKSPQLTNWRPLDGKLLTICGDNDESGREFIAHVIQLLSEQAPTATVQVKDLRYDWPEIPEHGDAYDWLIQLQSIGNDAILQRFNAIPDSSADYRKPGSEAGKPTTYAPVEIELTLDEKAVNDQVIEALSKRADIYVHNGRLVTIGADAASDGLELSTIRPLLLPTLREHIAKTCHFFYQKETPDGAVFKKFEHPLKWIYEAVFCRGEWSGIRNLQGVVNCPALRPDGSIVQVSGYDVQSGLFVHLDDDFPEIPEFPTTEQIRTSAAILADVVSDFPFKTDAHLAAWVASVLTPVARESYRGPTSPLFLIDANVRGSGKSLLGDLNSLIVEGREATRFTAPQHDEESRKRITALVENNDRVILIDNIVGAFGCASLDAALTGTTWKDRRLGHSTMIEAPLRMTWLGSGNNVVTAADTARRVCHIRIESNLENPEDRDGFKYPDIRKHVRKNRPALLAAALTILRGFIAAGRPNQHLKPWGSFEGWSDLVRQAVVYAGLADPGKTREELRENSDSEAGALACMLEAVNSIDSAKRGFIAAQLIQIAAGHDRSYSPFEASTLKEAIEQFCNGTFDRISSQKLGNRLKSFRNRVCGGMAFNFTKRNGNNCWFVQVVGGCGGRGGPDSSDLKREETASKKVDEHITQCSFSSADAAQTRPPHPPGPPLDEDIEWAESAFQ
jgi:hypothetical protein